MKKFLWTLGLIIVATSIVYLAQPFGKLNLSAFGLQGASFETIFDEAAKEISENKNLSAPAIFTISSFSNGYDSSKMLANLIENSLRAALAKAMPTRVTAYSTFKITEKKAVKESSKTAASVNASAQNDTENTNNDEADNADTAANSSQEILSNSGNFIVNGTYKEEDGELVISIFISDAENGRGYYARRLTLPIEKIPLTDIDYNIEQNIEINPEPPAVFSNNYDNRNRLQSPIEQDINNEEGQISPMIPR